MVGQQKDHGEIGELSAIMKKKKNDARVRYTKSVIKEALLEELKDKTFAEISVAGLCRRAEISRSTFYYNYNNSQEILRDIVYDILSVVPSIVGNVRKMLSCLPGNQEDAETDETQNAIYKDKRLKLLFTDPTCRPLVLDLIFSLLKDDYIKEISGFFGIDKETAEVILYFHIGGYVTTALKMDPATPGIWNNYKEILDTLMAGGLKKLQKETVKKGKTTAGE